MQHRSDFAHRTSTRASQMKQTLIHPGLVRERLWECPVNTSQQPASQTRHRVRQLVTELSHQFRYLDRARRGLTQASGLHQLITSQHQLQGFLQLVSRPHSHHPGQILKHWRQRLRLVRKQINVRGDHLQRCNPGLQILRLHEGLHHASSRCRFTLAQNQWLGALGWHDNVSHRFQRLLRPIPPLFVFPVSNDPPLYHRIQLIKGHFPTGTLQRHFHQLGGLLTRDLLHSLQIRQPPRHEMILWKDVE